MNSSKLNKCKTVEELRRYVIDEIDAKNPYGFNFKTAFMRATEKDNVKRLKFEDALIKVWNFEMQQENPCYLGKTKAVRHKGTAIQGMEVSGHR